MMEGYEVETCVYLPVKDGDTDYDGATYRRFDIASKDEAIGLAQRLLPKDCWGSVVITPFHREPFDSHYPSVLHKVYDGDSFYVD